jgi:cell division protein FtsB
MNDQPTPTPQGRSTPKTPGPSRPGQRILRYVLALVTVILVVDAIVGEKGLLALFQARRQYQAVEQALTQSRAANTQLREEARRLREDASAVEELARRELGLIRPGEKLFIIKEAPKK